MADVIYNSFKTDLLKGNIDFESDTIKVALVTDSYTPDQDSHDFFDDVTNEVSGTGYTAGGETLTSKSVTQDNIFIRIPGLRQLRHWLHTLILVVTNRLRQVTLQYSGRQRVLSTRLRRTNGHIKRINGYRIRKRNQVRNQPSTVRCRY
jgi:hypothetical protein